MSFRPTALVTAAATVALVLGLTGCGSGDEHGRPDVPTVAPQTPLPARVPAAPEGTVVAAPDLGRALALIPGPGGALAALARDGKSVAVYAGGDLNGAPVRTETPPMRAITADRDGFVAVGEKSVVRIGVRPTPATVVALARPGLAVAVDGNRVYVGTEDGHLLILDDRLHQVGDVGGLVRVDGVAVGQRNGAPQIVVLDRAQSLVTTINPNSSGRGAALRAGNGATTLVADHYGRFTVANTGDGQILGFYGEPLINRFRFPLPDGPYGLAYDDQRNLLWVSQTAVNRVTAFDLSAGEPRERTRFASVRQPDSIAVDPTSGAVYVLSATGDGLQRVTR